MLITKSFQTSESEIGLQYRSGKVLLFSKVTGKDYPSIIEKVEK